MTAPEDREKSDVEIAWDIVPGRIVGDVLGQTTAINIRRDIFQALSEARRQERMRVLGLPEVMDLRAVVIGGSRHDPGCMYHLDKKYPCPHHQTVEAFDKLKQEDK